ncbi:MAG TPA: hypothetical protein ENL27_02910 [Candidatus Parcubacteria bacterium]|nr:hypothetical protein [Candidatus Parcubacteria bacterium]
MPKLSKAIEEIVKRYQEWQRLSQLKEGASTIHVDEVASRVAAFYEKIKGVVEWREEHLLRKGAIERSLKRRVFLKEEDNVKELAESLVYELIRGGHFPNDKIPESKINDIQRILEKYFFIFRKMPKIAEEEIKLRDWLIEIASYEIEKTLAPILKEELLINLMTDSLKEKIVINKGIISIGGISEKEKEIQIFIACQKSLFKFDEPIISYYLLNKKYPNWPKISPKEKEVLLEISKNIYNTKQEIKSHLNHPASEKFFSVCERNTAPYLILGDIIFSNSSDILEKINDPEALEGLIKKAYRQRLTKLKKRIGRAAVYSTVSVFITKIALAIAIEIPIDKYITGSFNGLSLGINILFPPFLMFLLVSTIKPPSKDNLQKLTMEIMKLCYSQKNNDAYEIKIAKKSKGALSAIVFLFYGLTFIVSFAIIIEVLKKLNFGILSMAIFIFFVSVISFLGVKIRERSKELTVGTKKEGFIQSIFDFFTLPIVLVGKWLSEKWSKLNVALIISILIDAPLLTFVEFLEQWRYFLKEKKEKIH